MSAALVSLRTAIATNTLTALQQAALTQALDAIIPTFPVPDPSGVAQPPPDEDDAREWIAALYAIQSEGGGGPPVSTAGTIIAADGPTLSAEPVASLPNGQPAIVNSFGAEFTLQPIDGMTVDGSTVLATPDVTRVWERGDTVIAEQAVLQTSWFVDRTGGNDNNTGVDAAHAVQHKAEIMRRMGGWSPTIAVGITITYVTTDTGAAGADPGLWTPNFIQGGSLIHAAVVPAASFTGTLLAVTAKNVAGNVQLQSTVTTTTGAIAVGMFLVNGTHPSVAYVAASLGGGNFLLTQPMLSQVPTALGTTTNVDTWANGDAISGFQFLKIDLSLIGGNAAGLNAGFAPAHAAYHLDLIDSSATASSPLEVQGTAFLSLLECQVSRPTRFLGGSLSIAMFNNCAFLAGANVQSGSANALPIWAGGYCTSGMTLRGWTFTNNPVLLGTGNFVEMMGDLSANVYVHTGAVLIVKGQWALMAPNGIVYGPGTLNVRGQLTYATTATLQLPVANLELNGVASGYSYLTTGGLVAVHAVALTQANIDAAAGAAGFGGSANANGCCISNSNQP